MVFSCTCHGISDRFDACGIPPLIPYAFQDTCRPSQLKSSALRVTSDQDEVPLSAFTSSQLIQSSRNWTFEPFCIYSDAASTDVCVYTDVSFSSGRGISIIVTPLGAKHLRSLKPLYSNTNLAPGDTVRYELQMLPRRGIGVVATASLGRGDLLMAPTPVLLLQANVEKFLEKRDMQELAQVAMERLPKKTRELFMSLHAQFEKEDPIYERIETNGIRVFDFVGVLPELARLNHDCRPKYVSSQSD